MDTNDLTIDLGADARQLIRTNKHYGARYVASLYNEVTCPWVARTEGDHEVCRRVAAMLRKWRVRYGLPIEESDYSGRWIAR